MQDHTRLRIKEGQEETTGVAKLGRRYTRLVTCVRHQPLPEDASGQGSKRRCGAGPKESGKPTLTLEAKYGQGQKQG